MGLAKARLNIKSCSSIFTYFLLTAIGHLQGDYTYVSFVRNFFNFLYQNIMFDMLALQADGQHSQSVKTGVCRERINWAEPTPGATVTRDAPG